MTIGIAAIPHAGRMAVGLLKLASGALLVMALAAALQVLPHARDIRREEQIVQRILNLETLSPRRVGDALARLEARNPGNLIACPPDTHFHRLVLTGWLAEDALRNGGAEDIDRWRARATTVARESLACDPAQAFAIVVLLRQSLLQDGPTAQSLALLRRSYVLAPRDAWIMTRRAHAAVALQHLFAAEDSARLARDIAGLVESGIIREAVDILRLTDVAFQRMAVRRIGELPAAFQLAFQRRAFQFMVDLSCLTIPPPPVYMNEIAPLAPAAPSASGSVSNGSGCPPAASTGVTSPP
jgi:hypothetical protein